MLFPLLSLFAVSLLHVVTGLTTNAAPPPGFVSAKGTQFELDGKPFVSQAHYISSLSSINKLLQAFVGANSYVRSSGVQK
jgi:hypothetical protein